MADALFPYVKTGNYNDDTAKKLPTFHGGYGVFFDTSYRPKQWKNFFIHRNNYFIVQYYDDTMMDYELEVDTANRKFLLHNYYNDTDWELKYEITPDSVLQIEGVVDSVPQFYIFSRLDWQKMNLCEDGFRWRVDE